MRTAAPPREAFAAAIALISTLAAVDLRLRSGDERRQTIDAAIVRDHGLRLRLRLILRLRTMFARLLLLALIGRLRVAGIGLGLCRHEAGLLPEIRISVAVIVAVVGSRHFVGARLRLVLTELFLGGGDQAEIMFGVLIVVLGRHGI